MHTQMHVRTHMLQIIISRRHAGWKIKIASLNRQEPQPAGTTKWATTTLRFGKILGTTSVVRSIQNSQNVLRCKIHRP